MRYYWYCRERCAVPNIIYILCFVCLRIIPTFIYNYKCVYIYWFIYIYILYNYKCVYIYWFIYIYIIYIYYIYIIYIYIIIYILYLRGKTIKTCFCPHRFGHFFWSVTFFPKYDHVRLQSLYLIGNLGFEMTGPKGSVWGNMLKYGYFLSNMM